MIIPVLVIAMIKGVIEMLVIEGEGLKVRNKFAEKEVEVAEEILCMDF